MDIYVKIVNGGELFANLFYFIYSDRYNAFNNSYKFGFVRRRMEWDSGISF